MRICTCGLTGPTRLQPLLLSLLVPLLLQPTRGVSQTGPFSPRYGVVIDAGSSGSRVTVFQWDGDRPMGDSLVQLANSKTKPGISTLAATAEEQMSAHGVASAARRVHEHLAPLVRFAVDAVPSAHHATAGLLCYATAGVRLLDQPTQALLMEAVFDTLVQSPFSVERDSVAAISGEREAQYSYLLVNAALGRPLLPVIKAEARSTVGAMDMGGASTQISYLMLDRFDQKPRAEAGPKPFSPNRSTELPPLPINSSANQEDQLRPRHLLTTSHLGFGVLEAFKTLMKQARLAALDEQERQPAYPKWLARLPFVPKFKVDAGEDVAFEHPCMHRGQRFALKGDNHTFSGTGDFHACRLVARGFVQQARESAEALESWRASPPPPTTTFFAIDFFATVVDMMAHPAPSVAAHTNKAPITTMNFSGHSLHAPTAAELLAGGEAMCNTEWGEFVEWQSGRQGQPMKKVEAACFGAAYSVELFKAYRVFDVDGRRRNVVSPGPNPRLVFTEDLNGFEASWAVGALAEWGLRQERNVDGPSTKEAAAAEEIGRSLDIQPFAWIKDDSTWLHFVCRWITGLVGGWLVYCHLLAGQPKIVQTAIQSTNGGVGCSSPKFAPASAPPPPLSPSSSTSPTSSASKDGQAQSPFVRFWPSLGDLHF